MTEVEVLLKMGLVKTESGFSKAASREALTDLASSAKNKNLFSKSLM